MRVLVYLPEEKLTPKGGPLSVGYYYNEEMKRRGEHTLEFNHIDSSYEDLHKKGRIITSRLPKWLNEFHRLIRDINRRSKLLNEKDYAPKRNLSQYDIIHFHDSRSMFLERENLKDFKGIVLYQTHSPLPWGQEQCQDLSPWYSRMISNIVEKHEAIDKYCFKRADYIIFPCEEAEEPYADNWPFFKEFKLKHSEKFRYVLTGIMQAKAVIKREDILAKYDIPKNGFVISYVGRHNSVKGYDILKEIASKYFKIDENAWVISAGLESPFTRLKHPRWKEIGFTNDPHSLISATDVFILPNRVTYFDIVMIEILSLGQIVIASRTGGNKVFEKMNLEGVLLYDTIDEAVNLIAKVKNMTIEEKEKLRVGNIDFYKKYLSNSAMYENYIGLLKSLLKENHK